MRTGPTTDKERLWLFGLRQTLRDRDPRDPECEADLVEWIRSIELEIGNRRRAARQAKRREQAEARKGTQAT